MKFLDLAGVSTLVGWAKQTFGSEIVVAGTNKQLILKSKSGDALSTLSFTGGSNKFSISDGSNSFDVPITISITNNVTGSGTSGQMAVWTGANTIGSQAIPTIPTVNNAKFSVLAGTTEVASTTANASTASSVTFAAGSNVTITPDATNKKITISSTDTKVTSAANHYDPTADANSALSADASGATAAWGIDVVTGVNIQRDEKGHVTGVTVDSGKIPTNPVPSGNVTGTSLTANQIILGNGNSTVKASGKTIVTDLASATDNEIPTAKTVADAISALPTAMQFKGTLGTNGTATSLPAAAAANEGFAYKVITAGTYQSVAAKVGDMLISNGTSWVLIPSGDEPSGTVTNVAAGSGLTGGPITSSGTISHANTSDQESIVSSARTYISGVTLDDFGHVTGLATGTETVTNTDRYVNSAAFASQGTNGANGTKMTLTRAGSDTQTVTATIPVATTTAAGVMSGEMVTKLNGIATGATAVTESTVSGWGFTKNTGTVTSVTPGTGLTGTSSDAAITTSGTINLKKAATDEIGGIIVSAVGTSAVTPTNTTTGVTARAVVTDSAGKAYVNVPNYATSSGVTSITPGAGLVNGSGTKTAITTTGTVKAALVNETANAASATKATATNRLYAVELDKDGKLAVTVPWVDTGTTDEAITETELNAILYPSS